MEENLELTLSERINDFFVHNRKILLLVLVAVLLIIVVLISAVVVIEQRENFAIKEIETSIVDFEKFKSEKIKNAEDSLSDEEKRLLAEEETKLIETLSKYADEKNYAGFMAIQQIGDIYFKDGDFEKALSFYEKAPLAIDKYPSGVLFFNAGTCADELAENEKAFDFYTKASECKDFPFKGRALFNAARVQESFDKAKAIDSYKNILATHPNSEWAFLSKSRIIQLETKAK